VRSNQRADAIIDEALAATRSLSPVWRADALARTILAGVERGGFGR